MRRAVLRRAVTGAAAAVVAAISACGSIGDTTSTTPVATVGESRSPSEGFAAVTEPRTGHLEDGTNWTVMLPQVRGGDRQVRAAYNGQLDAMLVTLTGQPSGNGMTIGDGSLGTAERSRTVVGERTLSGVVIVLANAPRAAHPNTVVETVVLNSLTGEVIGEPFADPAQARVALAKLAADADPTGRLRDGASYGDFSTWIPLPEGLHLYVSVAHVLGDYVPVTIPWDKVTSLLKPDVRQVLVG